MRTIHALGAAVIAAALVVVPATVTPAQAAEAVRSLACYTSLTCNPGNMPILVEAGIVSGGSGAAASTAATGAVAGTVATGSAGTLGFGTVLGSVVAGVGLMTLRGLEGGVFIDTDPSYVDPASGNTCRSFTVTGSQTAAGVIGPISVAGTSMCGATVATTSGWAFRYVNAGPNGTGTGGKLEVVTQGPASLAYSAGWLLSTGANWSSATYCNFTFSLNTSSAYAPGTQLTIPTGCSGSIGPALDWALILPNGTGTSTGFLSSGVVVATQKYAAPGASGYHGTLRTTLTCTNSAGSNYVMQSARVDVAQGEPLPVPPATCDPGSVASAVLVEYQADGTTLWVEIGAATTPGTVVDLPSTYPDCFNGTVMTCKLQLQRTTNAGVSWEDCGPLAEYCPTWVAEWSETPSLYRCKYGQTVVSIDLCSAYRKPGMLLPNHGADEDEDGSPDPLPPGAPVPVQLPNPVRDPDTGEDVDLGKLIDTQGDANADAESAACFPTGWGVLNPVSWVLMPVQCALKWAFVPRADVVQAKLQRIKQEAEGGWLAAPVAIVGSLVGAVDIAASGCEGPPLHLHIEFPGVTSALIDETYYPMSACEEPMSGVASAVSGMISFGVIMLMGLALVRYVMTLIGYAPFGGSGGGGDRFVDSRTGEVL